MIDLTLQLLLGFFGGGGTRCRVNAALAVATLVASGTHTPSTEVSSSVSDALPVATLVAAGTHDKTISSSVSDALPVATLVAAGTHDKTISSSVSAALPVATLVAAVDVTPTPLSILGQSNLHFWLRADRGVTIGTGVSAWADQSGNGVDFSQATGSKQPAFSSSAGPNSQAAITGDGTDDFLANAALDLAAPGTTPLTMWMICKAVTWTANKGICGAGTWPIIYQVTSTPRIQQFAGGNANANDSLTLGDWRLVEGNFKASIADYLRVGSNKVTGQSASNADPAAGATIFSRAAGTTCMNVVIAEIFWAKKTLSAGEITALDAYASARYGSGVLT